MRGVGRFVLWTLIVLGGMIGILRATAIRWWKIPDDDPYLAASIAPTLRGGDWVLLWRLTPPVPGMLVLCPEPNHPDRVVIGRAIGDAEDKVKVQGSQLFLRGRLQESEGDCVERSFTVEDPETGTEVVQTCTTEVAVGLRHSRGNAPKHPDKPDFETTVGEGEFVLVSDNRQYPYDFRDYGAVDRATCKEMVFFRLIGADGFGSPRRFTYIR
jgi:signal peptidase I